MKEGQGVKLTKRVLLWLATVYLAVGVAFGSLLWASIPAMNLLGWGYYALTWPVFVCHGTKVCKGDASGYVPSWSFTFPRKALETSNG